MESKLKVLFVAAEMAPLMKVGGLGDVAGELPLKLQSMGLDVCVVIPANKDMKAAASYKGDFAVNMGWRNETCIVREALNVPVPVYLVDNYHYFGRSGVYGHQDDAERFAFFCLAVYEMMRHFEMYPDVVHLNDWHTAPLAMLLREHEREQARLSDIAVLYTIHNLEYQGISGRNVFKLFCMKDVVFKVDKVEYFGCFNAMKAGIHYSDIINGVSKTYARQMLTHECGFGLEGVLQTRNDAVRGVVNGINTANWNPETDSALYVNYNKESFRRKKENKIKLQEDLGLEVSDVPLFAVVSRLVPNKGLDLILDAARAVLKGGGQFVLLGSGEKYYENTFLKLMENRPDAVSVQLEFNDEKARRIYAASDVFLMPSRFEPCGLSQLIAMRYGSIPFVHKTGGLADTVIDEATNEGRGTGFAFEPYSAEALLTVMEKVLKCYRNQEEWNRLVYRAMDRDSSWEEPTKEYISLYHEAVEENRKRKTKKGRAILEKKGEGRGCLA